MKRCIDSRTIDLDTVTSPGLMGIEFVFFNIHFG